MPAYITWANISRTVGVCACKHYRTGCLAPHACPNVSVGRKQRAYTYHLLNLSVWSTVQIQRCVKMRSGIYLLFVFLIAILLCSGKLCCLSLLLFSCGQCHRREGKQLFVLIKNVLYWRLDFFFYSCCLHLHKAVFVNL